MGTGRCANHQVRKTKTQRHIRTQIHASSVVMNNTTNVNYFIAIQTLIFINRNDLFLDFFGCCILKRKP